MTNFDILEKLREQIDRTDEEILFLLKRRFQTSKKIAKYKLEHNIKIEDFDRENNLILQKISKSRTMNLRETFIRDLFETILSESKLEMNSEIEKIKNRK